MKHLCLKLDSSHGEEQKEVYSEDAQVMSVQPGFNVDKGAAGLN